MNTSTAEISSAAPLPVHVTNLSATSSLPDIFQSDAQLNAINFINGMTIKFVVHEVHGEWVLCDFEVPASLSHKLTWFKPASLTDFGWYPTSS